MKDRPEERSQSGRRRTAAIAAIMIIAAVAVTACDEEALRVIGSGMETTADRAVSSFDSIEVMGGFELQIASGGAQSLSITADDNILPLITTDVQDGTLRIDTTRSISPTKAPLVAISMRELTGIEVIGEATASVTEIDTEEFTVKVAGKLEMTASGTAGRVLIETAGASELHLFELVAGEVELDVSGAGDIEVFASDAVLGDVSGAAKIVYHGSPPTVAVSVAGTADLEAR